MRVLVVGAGGVGGYLGAKLALGGNDVTYVARGKHLEAMRQDGLKIDIDSGSFVQPDVVAMERLPEGPAADVVVIGVKLWSSEEAATAALPAIGPETMVVSFQNGIDAAQRIAAVVGRERVVGGVTYISSLISEPGVVRVNGYLQKYIFGEFDGSVSSRCDAFAQACKAAGVDGVASRDIERDIWEKFVFLVGASATTSLYRSPIGPIRENPLSRALLHRVMSEVVAVAIARGIHIDPAYAQDRMKFADSIPAGMRASMAGDLERGNKLEVPWLSGAVARLGDELGVPTPANHFIVDALALAVDGARS